MRKKLRQITDNVHETIYLSELESQLISTPFFYRLHDIYQSSTVYLTFPSNRTKRYEHSIGTMSLASQIFFAGMANAGSNDRKDFLEQLYDYSLKIVCKLENAEIEGVEYLKKVDGLAQTIPQTYLKKEALEECIFDTVKGKSILDSALEHYAVCFFDTLSRTHGDTNKQIAKYLFIYQIILEAIRVASLFHDVGHPPYSHIIEEVLTEIFKECEADKNNNSQKYVPEKREKLLKCLGVFVPGSNKNPSRSMLESKFLLCKEKGIAKDKDDAIHERVGLRMLQLAMEDVFPTRMKEIKDSKLPIEEKVGKSIYQILVVEFTFAILLEKSMIFKSIHRIVDGVIDADRLDYIVRDSQSSGVNWGRIPYKRLIDSAMLVRPDTRNNKFFAIAFPQKEQENLEDILLMRYKIFSRINYHHRSAKTATLLQNAVKELAFDYLESEEGQEISSDISGLWTALGATLAEKALQVGQWNDSWLITILYGALIKLSDENILNDFINKQNKKIDTLEKTRDLLEEVLLNHKHYYSLLKRKSDLVNLANLIFNKASIKLVMKQTKEKELKKYHDNTKSEEQRLEAKESLVRIRLFEKFLCDGDFDLFQIIFPASKPIINVISDILENEKKRGNIAGFYALSNSGRNKKGLPKSDDITQKIYLYDSDLNVKEYTGCDELEKQISSLRASCLGFYVYIKYKENDIKAEEIQKKIATSLGKELKKVYYELFPSNKKDR